MASQLESIPRGNGTAGVWQVLRKDIAVFTNLDRMMVFGAFFLASLQSLPRDEAFFLLTVALAGALAVYVPIIEWHQETDTMLHSLPVGRATVVIARYVAAMVAGGIAGMTSVVTGQLFSPILDAGRTTPGVLMTGEGILGFVVLFGLLVALFFPLFFKFGMGRGISFFLSTCLVTYACSHLLGEMDWVEGSRMYGLILPGHLVLNGMKSMIGNMGVSGTLAVVLVGLAIALTASARLSVWFFQRGDI